MMMKKGDISAKAELGALQEIPNLYALGALENLKGEIQIFDSQPFSTYVSEGQSAIDSTFDKKATLLVWATVDKWRSLSVPKSIQSFEAFEEYIQSVASKNGINPNNPFPFLLNGTARSIEWHIIDWAEGDREHSHEKHVKSGLNGTLEHIEVEILGFFSQHHKAIFTHHTTNIHSHFKTDKAPYGGHIDDLTLGKNMILKIPVLN